LSEILRIMQEKLSTILLIDDSEPINFMHQRILEQCEIANKIVSTLDGEEALNYLMNHGRYADAKANPTPQIIFLDIQMPKMNGFEFLEVYKQLNPSLKAEALFVILTTSLDPKDQAKAMENYDISGFIVKPLSHDIVHQIVDQFDGKSKSSV